MVANSETLNLSIGDQVPDAPSVGVGDHVQEEDGQELGRERTGAREVLSVDSKGAFRNARKGIREQCVNSLDFRQVGTIFSRGST